MNTLMHKSARQQKAPTRPTLYAITTPLLLAVLIGLSGCNDNDDNDSDTALLSISSALSGQQEVPSLQNAARGSSSVSINEETGDISGYVTGENLSGPINAAHIHSANAGQNGGVIIGLVQDSANANRFNIPDATQLTAEQLTLLKQGGLYFNMHTTAYPAGEIRGQILPSGYKLAIDHLSGENEVPQAVTTSASGTSYITYHNNTTPAATVNVRTINLSDATNAHLHQAFAGNNGPVIIPLAQQGAEPDLWMAEVELSTEQLAALKAGQVYANVHSLTNPSGELRGQITPEGVYVVRTVLSGDQEVPAVTSSASAVAYTTVNSAGDINAIVRTSGADDATAAHIHQAATGSNGAAIIPLAQDADDVTVWEAPAGSQLDAEQMTAFNSSGLYFNVHTPANTSGEVRGQIMHEDSNVTPAATDTTTPTTY